MKAPTTIDVERMAQRHVSITVKLTGMRRLRFRVWLGTQLLKLAGWVLPARVEVEPNRYSLPEDLEHLLSFILEGLARSESQRRRVLRRRR